MEINEDGTVGGSHQALFDLATRIDRELFEPFVLFYEENKVADRLRERGIDVHVWKSARDIERARRYNGGFRGRVQTAFKVTSAIRRRVKFLRRERVEIVHINNSPCTGFDDWLPAARLAGIPITCHSRGPYFKTLSNISRWLTRRFDAYVAISNYIADDLEKNGTPADRIRRIYDGIAIDSWNAPSSDEVRQLRKEFGVSDDTLLITHVGLIRSWKGQHVALEALTRLTPHERRRVKLWFVGGVSESERTYFESLQRRVTDAGLGDSVTFLGHRFDVSRLMSAADVVLHASTIPEPFGLVVLEGLALGKTVVASQLGGPAEVLQAGDGILFDPAVPEQLASVLSRLIAEPESRQRFTDKATARAKAFDVTGTVNAVASVWRTALANRAHGARRSNNAD